MHVFTKRIAALNGCVCAQLLQERITIIGFGSKKRFGEAGNNAVRLVDRHELSPLYQRNTVAQFGFIHIRRRNDDTDSLRFQFAQRSEEHTSELQSLMRISYAVFCLKKKQNEK